MVSNGVATRTSSVSSNVLYTWAAGYDAAITTPSEFHVDIQPIDTHNL